MTNYRIGIDLGGTKTEIAVLAADGAEVLPRRRTPTPPSYAETLAAIRTLVLAAEAEISAKATVGIGIPGCISPATGLVKNANSSGLNGQAFDADLSVALAREIRVANDANCFALSEAADGAGAGKNIVFGVILGTGVGGGIVVNGRILTGRHSLSGEWGHTPLPWPRGSELPFRRCWCGHPGCLESFLSGPALAQSFHGPGTRDASAIPGLAAAGDSRAAAVLADHADRLARGLAVITNILDPDVIVLGGGLSHLPGLVEALPGLMKPYIFTDTCEPDVRLNVHGDSSGVRGAAWLWPA